MSQVTIFYVKNAVYADATSVSRYDFVKNQALICKGLNCPDPQHRADKGQTCTLVRFCVCINAHPRTARPTMAESMTPQPSLDLIAERVERLLVRHEELQRTNSLLTDQVIALTQERDLLRLRLQAARARVDALIERLPANQGE